MSLLWCDFFLKVFLNHDSILALTFAHAQYTQKKALISKQNNTRKSWMQLQSFIPLTLHLPSVTVWFIINTSNTFTCAQYQWVNWLNKGKCCHWLHSHAGWPDDVAYVSSFSCLENLQCWHVWPHVFCINISNLSPQTSPQ